MTAGNGHETALIERAPSPAELDLMAYLDGELEPARIDEVEARLAKDSSYAAQLRELRALGDFVRDDAPRTYEAAKVDSIVDQVMARLEPEPARASRTSLVAPETSRSTRRAKSTVVWVSFGAVTAAAAAALIYMSLPVPPSNTTTTAQTQPTKGSEAVAVKSSAAATSHDLPTPPVDDIHPTSVEVSGLEVGQGATVIYTPEPGGSVTPVVWINETQ